MDFIFPVNQKMKIKGSKDTRKYLDFVREMANLGNVKLTMVHILVGKLKKNPD